MENGRPSLLELITRTVALHAATYFLMGLIASTYMDYEDLYEREPHSEPVGLRESEDI